MKSVVHILLIAALLPLAAHAREETMEERRQRIMRKYLRERQTIAQSDMVVPDAVAEDARVLDSEKFKQSEAQLSRLADTVPPPPVMLRPVPRKTEDNWLLGDDDAASESYADSFSMDSGSRSRGLFGEDGSSGRQSSFSDISGARREAYARSQPGSVPPQRSAIVDPRTSSYSPASFGSQGNEVKSGSLRSDDGGFFGGRTYGQSPFQETPFPSRASSSASERESESPASGYTPHKSPYQVRREQRSQQWDGQRKADSEFQRNDPYRQWKNRNQSWDPTGDRSYLDELMNSERR